MANTITLNAPTALYNSGAGSFLITPASVETLQFIPAAGDSVVIKSVTATPYEASMAGQKTLVSQDFAKASDNNNISFISEVDFSEDFYDALASAEGVTFRVYSVETNTGYVLTLKAPVGDKAWGKDAVGFIKAKIDAKQDTLSAGSGITISNNTVAAKVYTTTGQNTDAGVTQKLFTDTVGNIEAALQILNSGAGVP